MICKSTLGLTVTVIICSHLVRPDSTQAAVDEIGHDPLICDINSQSNQLTERNAPKVKSPLSSTNEKGKFSFVSPFISKYDILGGSPASCQLEKNMTRELKSTKGHLDLRGGLG